MNDAEMISKANANGNDVSFSLNSFLVGLVISGLILITAGITIFSVSSTQEIAMDLFSVKRGTTILLGALFGLLIGIVVAFIFERRSH